MTGTDFAVPRPMGSDITAPLQSTIDMARAAGGGRVVVPDGVWDTGAVCLFDNIELHLPGGATLRAATDYAAYGAGAVSVPAENADRALIVARDAANVAVSGPGWIDGQGGAWCGDRLARGVKWVHGRRPRIIVMEACRNVRIAALNIRQAPMWTIHLVGCRDIVVEDCTIENDMLMPNTDGVNFDGCQDGILRRCTITAADDCVCLKTSAPADPRLASACERILVAQCSFRSNSCAVKIGTETHNDVRDAVFSQCTISQSNRAFGIFSRDGGTIERICFENSTVDCHWTPDGFWGNGEAITINALPRRAGTPPGEVRDVVVRRVSGAMESTISLVGSAERPLKRIVLSEIDLRQNPVPGDTLPELDLRPTAADVNEDHDPAVGVWKLDAEGRVIGMAPYPGGLPGIWAEHVSGLDLRTVEIARPDPLPAGWSADYVRCGEGTRMADEGDRVALPRLGP